MEYTLRKVNATDIFTVTTIISKIGIREFKSCLKGEDTINLISSLFDKENEANNDAALSAVGISVVFDIVGVVLGNMEKCKDDIFNLLSNLSNIPKNEIATLDGEVFTDIVFEELPIIDVDFSTFNIYKEHFCKALLFGS